MLDPAKVTSKEDFLAFMREVREDLRTNPDKWENLSLDDFLESLAAWASDTTHDQSEGWSYVATLIWAGSRYE